MAFLNPVSNAKTVGFIIIIVGIIRLLMVPPMLVDQSTYDNPTNLLITLGMSITLIVSGLGLRKLKLWALYVFISYSILVLLITLPRIDMFIINLIVFGGLSVWFYSARKTFK